MITLPENKWAIIIGINGYHESLGNLDNCVNDAYLVKETLLSKYCGFNSNNVFLITDLEFDREKPTFGNIHAGFKFWLSKIGTNDLCLFYFAGHGRVIDGSCYLAPIDATLETLSLTGIPITYFQHEIERCDAKQKLLFLDACHSGAGRSISLMSEKVIDVLQTAKGIYTITSCSQNQLSYDYKEKRHGAFTYFLAESIRNKELANPKGYVSLDSVYEYTHLNVLNWALEHKMVQEPMRFSEGSGVIFISEFKQEIISDIREDESNKTYQSIDNLRERTKFLQKLNTKISDSERKIGDTKKPDPGGELFEILFGVGIIGFILTVIILISGWNDLSGTIFFLFSTFLVLSLIMFFSRFEIHRQYEELEIFQKLRDETIHNIYNTNYSEMKVPEISNADLIKNFRLYIPTYLKFIGIIIIEWGLIFWKLN